MGILESLGKVPDFFLPVRDWERCFQCSEQLPEYR